MITRKLIALSLALGLLLPAVAAAAPAPLVYPALPRTPAAGPCTAGVVYDPACDVDHDGDIDIFDIQKSAGHWNQSGVWVSDNNHTHLGQTWTGSNNPLKIDGAFGGAPNNVALSASNSADSGIGIRGEATGTGGVGVVATSTGGPAIWTQSTNGDGVVVNAAAYDGIHVSAASDNGLHVQSAGNDALFVASTNGSGLMVLMAGANGLQVAAAGNDGVNVTGNRLAGYFLGNVQIIGSCTGCLLATFGINTGDRPLAPGDLVSLAGLRPSGVDSVPMLLEVQAAAGDGAIVGVVTGWAELVSEEAPRPAEIGLRLVPRPGAAEPGQHVTIAYSGLTQVQASGPLPAGARLTVDEDGRARALQTRTLDGMEVSEGAQTIGLALEPLPAGDGLIWALLAIQ